MSALTKDTTLSTGSSSTINASSNPSFSALISPKVDGMERKVTAGVHPARERVKTPPRSKPAKPLRHVRKESWHRLTKSCADLIITKLPSATPSTTRLSGPTPSQKKRRSDGSLKEDGDWQTPTLQEGVLQTPSRKRSLKARLSMDLDVLRRRIAVIEAHDRGRELREAGSGPVQADWESQLSRRRSALRKEHTILDWEEAVVR
jgi:hypothetical protein